MCNNLRKVKYLLEKCGFDPDATTDGRAEMEERAKEHDGYFHRWVDDVDTSKDIPFIKTVALIEDKESGKLYTTESANIRFVKD